jgi:hypothetical protein
MGADAQSGVQGHLVIGVGATLEARAENFWKWENVRRPDGCRCEGCRNFRRQEGWVLAQLGWANAPDGSQTKVEQLILNQTWLDLPGELAALPIECERPYLAWSEDGPNLVTTEGKNDALTQYLKGASYTAAFYVALVDNANFTAYAAGDTAAQINGTNGWDEGVPYSNATRVAWTGGTASGGSISNTASPAAFNINATLTVRGGFLDTSSVKSGTAGVLYGENDFAAPRAVLSGDTLNVTVTCTL